MRSQLLRVYCIVKLGLLAAAFPAHGETAVFSFDDAPTGVWKQIGCPAGWLSSDMANTSTDVVRVVQAKNGTVVTRKINDRIQANVRYSLEADLGGDKNAVAKIALVATENPDGTGKSVELVSVQEAGSGKMALSGVSANGHTVSREFVGYHVQLNLIAPASGVGLFGNIRISKAFLDDIYLPIVKKGIECVEFSTMAGDHQINTILASPPKDKLSRNPVLLLVIGRANAHLVPPNDLPAKYFLGHGHRVVFLTVSVVESSLEILRDAILKGPDPFPGIVQDAQSVLKYCIDHHWAKPDRIVVIGISRNAYTAFRLMAQDSRIKIGGGFSPVTDWRDLSEFSEQKEMKLIADYRLSNYAGQLAGKHIFMTIGSQDRRVNTLSTCQFYLDLNQANRKQRLDESLVNLYLTPDINHACGDEWYNRGMEILLSWAVSKDNKP